MGETPRTYLLKSKTKIGARFIREHGDKWFCYATRNKIASQNKPGPWLLLYNINRECKLVHLFEDEHLIASVVL